MVLTLRVRPIHILTFIAVLSAAATVLFAWLYPNGQAVDGYSYVDLADAYAEGRWDDAVNGYWSVLLPVLLAPARFSGANGITAYAIVSVVTVVCTIFFTYGIGVTLGINKNILLVVSAFIGARSALFSMEAWNADLLFAAIGLGITLLAVRIDPRSPLIYWVGLGLACGFLYYAKPAGLYTGFAMVLLAWLAHHGPVLRESLQRALSRFGLALLGYGAAVIPWFLILTNKYGYFTTGYSGKHNLAISGSTGALPFPLTLWKEPFSGATSYSGDYTYVAFELPYSIFSRQGVSLIWSNIQENLQILVTEQPILIALIFLSIVLVAAIVFRSQSYPALVVIVLGVGVIQTFVYVPVLIEHRYLYLSLILVALASMGSVHQVSRHDFRRLVFESGTALTSIGMILTFNFSQGFELASPLSFIETRESGGLMRAEIAESIDLDSESCTNLAAHWGRGGVRRNETMEIAHFFDWFNAGTISHDLENSQIPGELRKYDINCVLVWDKAEIPESIEPMITLLGSDSAYGVVDIYRFDPVFD